MGLLNVIRRMHLRQKLSIREIARRTGLSRNTVTKHLAAGTVEPTFATPDRPSKLAPFASKLAGWLKTEAGKSRKQRRTLKQLHADLVALGFTGSYGRVAAFARRWREERQREQQTTGRGTFVPLSFRPGEAFQFDWSEDFAVLGGERAKLQMAHVKLAHSRAFLLRAYPLQTHEMLFDAHWHAFRVFGGVPGRGIYDNMKTAVDCVGRGKERQINMRFLAMTNHYVYEPDFCNPAAGWEKGQVEKNVRDSRHQMLQGMPDFPDLAALNAWLEQRCQDLWRETAHGTLAGTIADVWVEEQAALMPLPVAFDGFIELSKRVSPTCLISFERNRYSVPASFANRPVSLRIYPDRLVVAAEGNILCEHLRIIERSHHLPSRTIYDWRHYLAVVQRKPGALRKPIDKGFLYKLINNRVYIGEAVHKGTSYPGEHEAIIDRALWNKVHAILQESPRLRASNTRAQTPALLKGLIFTDTGTAMTPTATKKGSKLYRYYTSMDLIRSRTTDAAGPQRLAAGMVEDAVIGEIRRMIATPEIRARALAAMKSDRPDIDDKAIIAALGDFDALWASLYPAEQARIVQLLVARVTVGVAGIAVDLRHDGIGSLARQMVAPQTEKDAA